MPADIAPIQHNDHHQLVAQDFQSQKFHYEAIGEHVLQLEDYMIEDFAAERMGIFWHRQKPHYVGEKPWLDAYMEMWNQLLCSFPRAEKI